MGCCPLNSLAQLLSGLQAILIHAEDLPWYSTKPFQCGAHLTSPGQTISAFFLVCCAMACAKQTSMLRTFSYDTVSLYLCSRLTNFLLLVSECKSRARNTASGGSHFKFVERGVIFSTAVKHCVAFQMILCFNSNQISFCKECQNTIFS